MTFWHSHKKVKEAFIREEAFIGINRVICFLHLDSMKSVKVMLPSGLIEDFPW